MCIYVYINIHVINKYIYIYIVRICRYDIIYLFVWIESLTV